MCPSRRQLFEDSSPHSDALTLGLQASGMSRAARRCTHSTVHGAPVEAATPVFRRTAGAAASGRQASYVPEVHATWDMALRIMTTYKSQTCILESTCQGVGRTIALRTAVTVGCDLAKRIRRGFDLRPDARTTAASAVPSACVPRRMARLLIDLLVEGTLDWVDDGVAEVVSGREQVDARDIFEHEVPALEALE